MCLIGGINSMLRKYGGAVRSAVLVGTGLIGTSAALALRKRGVTTYLMDLNETAAQTAEALGAGLAQEPPEPADIAVIAVPPVQVAPVLAKLQRQGLARFYTDVASVKCLPYRESKALGCELTSVVGGHPLVGGEWSGPLAARSDLFEGHPWVLVPTEYTSEIALNSALELVSLCGATPVVLDAETHDRAVALVSHAPHLIASLMAARLLDGGDSILKLAGHGLRDIPRIAAGNPALWTDILSANAGPVACVLEQIATDAGAVARALRALDEGGEQARVAATQLTEMLQEGSDARTRIPGKHGIPDAVFGVLEVLVGDDPGELARLFADVASVNVNIEDITMEHATDQRAGRAHLSVVVGRASPLRDTLLLRGWTVVLPRQMEAPINIHR